MVCKNFFYPSASMKLARIFQRKREKKKYRCPFIRIINKRYRRGAERLSRKSHATHGHLYRMCRGWTGKFRKKSLRRVKLGKLNGSRGVIINVACRFYRMYSKIFFETFARSFHSIAFNSRISYNFSIRARNRTELRIFFAR